MPASISVFGRDGGVGATAYIEFGRNACEAGTAGRNDVVQDLVCNRFMERTLVTKRPDIKLECLQLDTFFGWYIFEQDLCEIGLSR